MLIHASSDTTTIGRCYLSKLNELLPFQLKLQLTAQF